MRRRSAARRRLPSSRTAKNKRSFSSMIEIVMRILHHCNHEPALSTRIEKTYLGNVDNEEQKQSRKYMNNNSGQQLAGKIAVITGGSSGIGLATARRFVDEGAHVVITGRREKELKEAAAFIKRNVTTVVGDVSRLEDLDRLYAVVKEKHGHIDVLFANAGAGTIAPLGVATEGHFDQTFDVNVKGLFFTVQKALPLFKDGGSIILNSSVSNVLGLPGFTAYAASKAAVRNFARGWTLELKDRKIRVNCMSPGAIDTPALALNRPSKRPHSSPRRSQWAAEACPRKSRKQSCSLLPMKVLTSPVWISRSLHAWRRSDHGAVASRS